MRELPARARRRRPPPYTRGWFQLGWSDRLRRGQLRKVRQFGQTLCLFRGEDGALGLLDDVCPHLGAHLSEGGTVQGTSVRCPYHHWCFDRAGACTGIPYAKKIPPLARVRAHPVVERHGMIFTWRSEDGGPPARELPAIEGFDEGASSAPARFEFAVRVHGQDIMENSVDAAHFRAVHGHATPENTFTADGPELRITQAVAVRRFGRELKARLEFRMIEPGFHYLHFPEVLGTRALVFSSIAPIDEELTNHRLSIWVSRSRVPGLSWLVRRFVVWQMMRTYREDLHIWENKEHLADPVLCDGDGAIPKLRRWYSQFYEPGALAQATPASIDPRSA